jgi:fluoroquinolone resistance protein
MIAPGLCPGAKTRKAMPSASNRNHLMNESIIENAVFERINFSETPLEAEAYENCRFLACDFTAADLKGLSFESCLFSGCNLSQAKNADLSLKHADFKSCKLLGWNFQDCKPLLFSVSFDGCILDFSRFIKMKLANTVFKDCSMKEVDFIEADLTGASFPNCDLMRAVFNRTHLERADFRTAFHFSIDPEKNKLKKARFSLHTVTGLLGKYGIVIE